jgi:hypothetical protein
MPAPPEGEAELRDLAQRFMRAEGLVLAHLAEATTSDRTRMAKQALEVLAALRLLDFRTPVVLAYMAENPWKGNESAVDDLAGSLAKRLDQGARTAADGVRDTFTRVNPDTLGQLLMSPLTAAVDARGNHWALGAWAAMNTTTIGRQATSRGLADRIGSGGRVVINTGSCALCNEHGGEGLIGEIVLPPYHPSCSCVASAA